MRKSVDFVNQSKYYTPLNTTELYGSIDDNDLINENCCLRLSPTGFEPDVEWVNVWRFNAESGTFLGETQLLFNTIFTDEGRAGLTFVRREATDNVNYYFDTGVSIANRLTLNPSLTYYYYDCYYRKINGASTFNKYLGTAVHLSTVNTASYINLSDNTTFRAAFSSQLPNWLTAITQYTKGGILYNGHNGRLVLNRGPAPQLMIKNYASAGPVLKYKFTASNVFPTVLASPPPTYDPSFRLNVPAWNGNPSAEVKIHAADSNSTIESNLEALPQIISATVTGGPIPHKELEFEIEWADSTINFSSWDQLFYTLGGASVIDLRPELEDSVDCIGYSDYTTLNSSAHTFSEDGKVIRHNVNVSTHQHIIYEPVENWGRVNPDSSIEGFLYDISSLNVSVSRTQALVITSTYNGNITLRSNTSSAQLPSALGNFKIFDEKNIRIDYCSQAYPSAETWPGTEPLFSVRSLHLNAASVATNTHTIQSQAVITESRKFVDAISIFSSSTGKTSLNRYTYKIFDQIGSVYTNSANYNYFAGEFCFYNDKAYGFFKSDDTGIGGERIAPTTVGWRFYNGATAASNEFVSGFNPDPVGGSFFDSSSIQAQYVIGAGITLKPYDLNRMYKSVSHQWRMKIGTYYTKWFDHDATYSDVQDEFDVIFPFSSLGGRLAYVFLYEDADGTTPFWLNSGAFIFANYASTSHGDSNITAAYESLTRSTTPVSCEIHLRNEVFPEEHNNSVNFVAADYINEELTWRQPLPTSIPSTTFGGNLFYSGSVVNGELIITSNCAHYTGAYT